MKKHQKLIIASILPLCILFSSCKEDTSQDKISRMGINYFSVNQYIFDQWRNFDGHPFAILKTKKINGKTDSTYTNSEKFDWTEVMKILMETDISDKELLGRYKFTQYEDKEDNTVNFYYQAIEDESSFIHFFDKYQDLLTKKLLITANPFTNHINGLYIETLDHSLLFGDTNQKLYYAPFKTLQIQKNVAPLIGAKKNIIIQYYFLP